MDPQEQMMIFTLNWHINTTNDILNWWTTWQHHAYSYAHVSSTTSICNLSSGSSADWGRYLRPFRKSIYTSQIAKPAPQVELIDREEEWEVEEIKRLTIFTWTTAIFGSLEGFQPVWRHSGTCQTPGSRPRIGHRISFTVPHQTKAQEEANQIARMWFFKGRVML